MSTAPTPSHASAAPPAGPGWVPAAVIGLAVLAAYRLSLSGGFLFDDLDSVLRNPSIARLATAAVPPARATVSGRPVLNLSLAANHVLSGNAVWSYHAANLLIHAAAALLLFGIVRRTLATRAGGSRAPADATRIGLATALLWALHPLQVGSVAYVVQRAESLMGFFYLLTLYAFIRSALGGKAAWSPVCFTACLLGMGTKEVMVTAPLLVLLYDRVFLAGSFREGWRRRRGLYLALAACWLPLVLLTASTGGRGGTAGLGSGVGWFSYLEAQGGALAHYLRLAVWPQGLVGDYGRILHQTRGAVVGGAALVLAIAAATLVLLRRSPGLGFLGAWFLGILAPTSSVVPISTEIMAEHRMYLPLAAVVVLAVLLLARLRPPILFAAGVALLALGLGTLTFRRTRVYANNYAFWTDVALKVPGNAGAWNNLGILEDARGNRAAAAEDFGRALAAVPDYADAHRNLANLLAASGEYSEAVRHFRAALRYQSANPAVHAGLARALASEGLRAEAVLEYREAVRLAPALAPAWYELGNLLADLGDLPEAAEAFGSAVRLAPEFADAHVNYGNVLAQQGRLEEAVGQFREALRLQPDAADVHNNLGSLLAGSGRTSEARAQFEEALRLRPDYPDAQENLARLRAREPGGAPR